MRDDREIVSEINEKVAELNALFEKAALHCIKFDCSFKQDQSFYAGKVAHLIIKSYEEIITSLHDNKPKRVLIKRQAR